MQLRTFSAATMAEALRQVKAELGGEAVILHTRTYQRRFWLGLRRCDVVEVTAGRGAELSPHPRRHPKTRHAAEPPPSHPPPVRPHPRSLLETPSAAGALMVGLSNEMQGLKTMVMDLVRQTRSSQAPSVPEDLFDHYLQLVQSHVAEELAADVIRTIQANLRADHRQNAQFVRQKIAEQIEKFLPTSGPLVRTKTVGAHVVALIGPTGVGKTTTIAKLAANLKLREHRRVGLITIDTYRIAAVDQLRKYAEIIGSPLRVVASPEDLRDAVAAMCDCEFVLIDTAGRSPCDALKLNELKNFLAAAAPDEVHLVLSTTASQECIERAIERFTDVRVDKIIFTKLDEAVHVGVVLNIAKKVNKALSYVTTGQDVPDDIEVSQGRRLAQMILGGQP